MKSKTNINRALYFKIGLAMSLGLALLAFEWKQFEEPSMLIFQTMEPDIEKDIDIPITEYERPKPKVQPKIMVVKDIVDEDTTDLQELFTEFVDSATVVEFDPVDEGGDDEPFVEVAEKIHTIVEVNASPDGGMSSFYKYIRKNLKYPRQAKRMGIEGKVFLQFVVDKTGQITELQVIRGIGGGCDEEAVRILKNSPRWNPGKQRGNPVKQRMTFPINFKLK